MSRKNEKVDEIQTKYQIISLITVDVDSFKSVFLVRHKEHGFLRVLKRINLDLLSDFNELLLDVIYTKQLKHPNVVCYLDTKVIHNYLYISTPFFAYGSCYDLITTHFVTGLPEIVIAIITKGVLEALSYLHAKGFIHRAVCGRNIFISANGLVCLSGIKFGCQIIKDNKRQSKVCSFPHNSKKNLNWLSPEILEQNSNGYNEKSDIYSLGITLCELGNGVVPFSYMPSTFMLLEKSKGIVPQLFDSSTFVYKPSTMNFHNDELDENTQDICTKWEIYSKRKFTIAFHKFKELCLFYNPNSRPTAKDLLSHSFVKSRNVLKVDFQSLMYPVIPMSAELQNRNEIISLIQDCLDNDSKSFFDWN